MLAIESHPFNPELSPPPAQPTEVISGTIVSPNVDLSHLKVITPVQEINAGGGRTDVYNITSPAETAEPPRSTEVGGTYLSKKALLGLLSVMQAGGNHGAANLAGQAEHTKESKQWQSLESVALAWMGAAGLARMATQNRLVHEYRKSDRKS